ncbi:MAG: DMT family transporter [Nanoarchaeota archaeon]|nr:DMT family transporter [Nanoarchaeota archaeon]
MKNKGLIFVLFTAIISGCSIFLNQFGVKGIDSTVFTFMKNSIVALFLLGIIVGFSEFRHLKKLSKKEWLTLVSIGLIGGSIPFVLFFRGLQLSGGAVGSFVHKTMFIMVAVLAVVFLREKLSKRIFIPMVLLLIGNYLLLKIGKFEFNAAALLILAATMFWAVENVISKRALKTIEPRVLAFGRLFFGSLFIMAYMLVTGKFTMIFTINVAQFSWILLSAPFLLFYVITWYTGLKHVKVTTATSILLLGSPITTLLSFAFLGKMVDIMQLFGIVLILSGIVSMILFMEKKDYSTISIA